MLLNVDFFVYLNLFLFISALILLAFLIHKVRRIHLKQFEAESSSDMRINNLFAQIEALAAIHQDLGLSTSLPATRGWAASPDFLRHIARTATDTLPLNVVECSSGASTIVLARVMQQNGVGHVFSLEHDQYYANKTREEVRRQGLEAFATVIDAPLRSYLLTDVKWQWYETKDLPKSIDLLVIDGPPASVQLLARYPAIPILDSSISPTGYVILDDANRPDERIALRRWDTEFAWMSAENLQAEKGIAKLTRKPAVVI
jgi:predicted O-methyltransferase YrrM